MDLYMKLLGVAVAVVFGVISYRAQKAGNHPAKLVAPPKKVDIDPHNIPIVEEPRKWSASDATIKVGVPINPSGGNG